MQKDKLYFLLSLFLLFIFGIFLYLPYIGIKEFQGEEGRRVLIALQMLESKEFLIPHLSGKYYFNKPPLFNWILAGFFSVFNDCSEFIARGVSSFFAILNALFLTFIWKKILEISQIKISFEKKFFILLIPGFIVLTTPEAIDKALRAEIDMTYTFILTLGLFLWFYFYEIKEKKYTAFFVSGVFLGLGILTKTFQAILFFYLALIPYFFFQRRFKEFFSTFHFMGIVSWVGIFCLWSFLVGLKTGFNHFLKAWIWEYKGAITASEMTPFQHLKAYTLSALLGYSPWIFFLFQYKNKEFRLKFLKEHPILYKLFLFSFFLFFFSYLFHFFFFGARLRYILPSISGFTFLVSLSLLHISLKELNFIHFKNILTIYLPILFILSSFLFIYYIFFQKIYIFLPFMFYIIILLFITMNFLILYKKPEINFKFLLFYFISLIFLLKHIYVSFYYFYHVKNMNHFRNSAFKIAKIVNTNIPFYLCKSIPHHTVYYLKYKYKLIKKIKYVDSCNKVPSGKWVLIPFKYFSRDNKYEKIFSLKIRTKKYILAKTK